VGVVLKKKRKRKRKLRSHWFYDVAYTIYSRSRGNAFDYVYVPSFGDFFNLED
jgi:hypothetical protein